MGTTKQEIVAQITSEKKYLSICKRLLKGNSLYEDLYQDFIIELLEAPDTKFDTVKCTDCFLYKMLKNMVNSKTSKFYYKYRKGIIHTQITRRINTYDDNISEKMQEDYLEDQEIQYDESIDQTYHTANHLIEKLPLHDKKILSSWIDGNSDRKIAAEKSIPRYFVTRKIKTITTKIKQEVKMQELGHPIKILLVIQPNKTALQYHRQYMPHERLLKTHLGQFQISYIHGGEQEASIDSMTDEQLQEHQIIYYLRQISFDKAKIQPTLDRIKRLGIKIMLDIDDYWFLPSDHHWHKMYKDKGVAENTIHTLKQVDHVITTTPYFAGRILEHNKNVTILPNCISPDAAQFERRDIESPRMRFGWIGGVFHQPDIKMIDKCFSKINDFYSQKNLKNTIQISVGGFSCNYEYKEIEKTFTSNYYFRNTDATYYNYLQQCTPTMEHISYDKPYRRLWGRSIETYGELYNEIDVALVPLKDNTFNKCKSELKIVEAGWMKKAVICSDITPYHEYIKHGVNGLLVAPSRNNIDWVLSIRKLSQNPSMVSDMAEALYETISKNFDMDTHNKTRAELYKSLL